MVDFNDGNTIGTPAADIVRVLILERRTNVLEALEAINKRGEKDIYDTRMLRARMQTLYWELSGMLKRKKKADEIRKILFDRDAKYEDLIKVFDVFDEFLDDIRLTRIDNHKTIDTRNVENDNEKFNV